ncbi:MAG: enolase C-terminal domain-like protein [Longimicrobiales bacterium]
MAGGHTMDRRGALKALTAGGAGLAAVMVPAGILRSAGTRADEPVQQVAEPALRGLPPLRITDVRTIPMTVGRNHLTVVKVLTDEPGLYGVGCGTHSERQSLVVQTIEQYLKPAVVGRYTDDINDIWHMAWTAPYWRASVDASNAMSAIDGALWDILGKRAGVPVHQLLGGKLRPAVPLFTNAGGSSLGELEDNVRAAMEQGYDFVRIRYGGGRPPADGWSEVDERGAPVFPQRGRDITRVTRLVEAFEHLRNTVGWDVELSHDVHENLSPSSALTLAKACEPLRLHFLEDLFAPEDVHWHEHARAQSSTPIAFGELIVNRNEWLPLVANRWIDFIRCHISAIGGLTEARKVAQCCECFGVRTSWHGPANVSPIGHAVNTHLDLATYNFGIAEGEPFSEELQELFPGAPERRNGMTYPNDLPGLGVDIDETRAVRYPPEGGRDRGERCFDMSPCRP